MAFKASEFSGFQKMMDGLNSLNGKGSSSGGSSGGGNTNQLIKLPPGTKVSGKDPYTGKPITGTTGGRTTRGPDGGVQTPNPWAGDNGRHGGHDARTLQDRAWQANQQNYGLAKEAQRMAGAAFSANDAFRRTQETNRVNEGYHGRQLQREQMKISDGNADADRRSNERLKQMEMGNQLMTANKDRDSREKLTMAQLGSSEKVAYRGFDVDIEKAKLQYGFQNRQLDWEKQYKSDQLAFDKDYKNRSLGLEERSLNVQTELKQGDQQIERDRIASDARKQKWSIFGGFFS